MSITAHRLPLRAFGTIVLVAGLAACSGSTTAPSAVPTQPAATPPIVTPAPSASATASAQPSPSSAALQPSPTPEATAVATSIDPCQLIPADEAGTLAGAKFGPGKEETTSGNSRICTYGANTHNVFQVIVAIAPDEMTAKKEEAAAEADARASAGDLAKGLVITKLPSFAPDTDAVLMEIKPNPIVAGRAIYLLRGTTFFGFSDLVTGPTGGPSTAAVKDEAMTVLGRLP